MANIGAKAKGAMQRPSACFSFILILHVRSHFMTLVAELCRKVRSVFSIITRYHGSCSHLTSCCTRHDKHIKYTEPFNLFMCFEIAGDGRAFSRAIAWWCGANNKPTRISYKYKSNWKRLWEVYFLRAFVAHENASSATRTHSAYSLLFRILDILFHLEVSCLDIFYQSIFRLRGDMCVSVRGIDSWKWKRKMNLLSNNEWNKLCACVLYIISCYLSHFIWYVISVKHVFIIRFHRSLLCISITINVCISFRCVFYMAVNFSFCTARLRALTLFPGFKFTSLKSNSWSEKPHRHVYSLLHHDRFT